MIYIGKQGEAAWGDYPPQTEQIYIIRQLTKFSVKIPSALSPTVKFPPIHLFWYIHENNY